MPAEEARPLIAGRYRVLRRLGAGGVAAVFLAEDERLAREVAIKRLHADSPEEMARRFEREARVGASLNHPNLVAIYDVATDESDLLIVMEYVEGRTLAEALKAGPLPRPGDEAVVVLSDVASGLDHAHSQGVVHRDVKPANVLLGRDGRVKLADLGIARAAEATDITGTGVALGTPAYMAPEQLVGGSIGPAADVYALAAVAFEVLTGHRAHTGRSPIEIAHRVTSEPPPDIREHWPEAPATLAETLMTGMAADPAERPRSAGELTALIERALPATAALPSTEPVPTEPAAPPPIPIEAAAPPPAPAPASASPPHRAASRRRPMAIAAAAVLLLGAVAAILILASGGEPAAPPETAPPTAAQEDPPAREARPDQTVVDFYELSASGDYRGAWELASPAFRQQLQGFAAFEESQSTLESIQFDKAETVDESGDSAEVAIQTVARHTDRTDECEGSLEMSRAGDGWLIEQASIDCS